MRNLRRRELRGAKGNTGRVGSRSDYIWEKSGRKEFKLYRVKGRVAHARTTLGKKGPYQPRERTGAGMNPEAWE